MKGDLTEAQRRFLDRARRETLEDDSGPGVHIWGGEHRTAFALARRGLVTLGAVRARITPAGRSALSSHNGGTDG